MRSAATSEGLGVRGFRLRNTKPKSEGGDGPPGGDSAVVIMFPEFLNLRDLHDIPEDA